MCRRTASRPGTGIGTRPLTQNSKNREAENQLTNSNEYKDFPRAINRLLLVFIQLAIAEKRIGLKDELMAQTLPPAISAELRGVSSGTPEKLGAGGASPNIGNSR